MPGEAVEAQVSTRHARGRQSCWSQPLRELPSRGRWAELRRPPEEGRAETHHSKPLCSPQLPDSSCFFISSLFPDKPLPKRRSWKQLEQVPLAGGVWQAGSQIQPPNHSSSHLKEGRRETRWGCRAFRLPVDSLELVQQGKGSPGVGGGSCSPAVIWVFYLGVKLLLSSTSPASFV